MFDDCSQAIAFLDGDLRWSGKYYYRRGSIVYEKDLVILFQLGGQVVASASMIGQSDDGMIEDGVEYKGYNLFDINSLKVYKSPITEEQIRRYLPDFKGFDQSTQRLENARFAPTVTPEKLDAK